MMSEPLRHSQTPRFVSDAQLTVPPWLDKTAPGQIVRCPSQTCPVPLVATPAVMLSCPPAETIVSPCTISKAPSQSAEPAPSSRLPEPVLESAPTPPLVESSVASPSAILISGVGRVSSRVAVTPPATARIAPESKPPVPG